MNSSVSCRYRIVRPAAAPVACGGEHGSTGPSATRVVKLRFGLYPGRSQSGAQRPAGAFGQMKQGARLDLAPSASQDNVGATGGP